MKLLKKYTPLEVAAEQDHPEIIITILSSLEEQQRLDVLILDDMTTLHWAAHYGRSERDCEGNPLTPDTEAAIGDSVSEG